MKNIKTVFAASVFTFALSGNVFAQEQTVNTVEIQTEIADQIQLAVSQINTPVIEDIAKAQLDEMSLKQNIEQFLALARFNEETAIVNTQIIAE